MHERTVLAFLISVGLAGTTSMAVAQTDRLAAPNASTATRSGPLSEARTVPGAPTPFLAAPGDISARTYATEVSLAWHWVKDLERIKVCRREPGGAPCTALYDGPPAIWDIVDRGLLPGTMYAYELSGTRTGGTSLVAPLFTTTTRSPEYVMGLRGLQDNNGTVTLTWTPVANVKYYVITGTAIRRKIKVPATGTSIDIGPNPPGRYTYRIAAFYEDYAGRTVTDTVAAHRLPQQVEVIIAGR